MDTPPERRRFNRQERAALYRVAGGVCERCGAELEPGWHADHVQPWSKDGKTDVINGQALCPPCNLTKGNRMGRTPRLWQQRFFAKYHGNSDPDFLLVACPGAGKTYAAAYVARDLLEAGAIDRVLVVVPQTPLRKQWHDTFRDLGVWIDYDTMNDPKAEERREPEGERKTIDGNPVRGWAITYGSLMAAKKVHRVLNERRRTMVILDEVHHLRDGAGWGEGATEALGPCVRRLALSGTPFRSDRRPIPFVEYFPDDDPDPERRGNCRYADDKDRPPYPFPRGFDYSYGTALAEKDPPVTPIIFQIYDGDAAWLEGGSEDARKVAVISDTSLGQRMRAKVRRHSLNVEGNWLLNLLEAADQRLSSVRGEGDPDAKGLVVCIDTKHADHVYRTLNQLLPGRVRKAVSKDAAGNDCSEEARKVINGFGLDTRARWLVAVQMVSEGVDIPQLRVGVYATTSVTDLLARQTFGRVVRHREDLPKEVDQTAYFLLPRDPEIVAIADNIEGEVKQALLAEDDEYDEKPRKRDRDPFPPDELPFDTFLESNAGESELLLPGFGRPDPILVAKLAMDTGDGEAAAARALAALARMGHSFSPSEVVSDAVVATPVPEARQDDFVERLDKEKAKVNGLVKQIASALLKRDGVGYSQREFQARAVKAWAEVKKQAGIADWDRADLPDVETARRIASKLWGDLA